MAAADLSRDVEPQRGHLLPVARLQPRDEAFAGGCRAGNPTGGTRRRRLLRKSSLRTWLILKHKIVGVIRRERCGG
jgi:hypothetical protein